MRMSTPYSSQRPSIPTPIKIKNLRMACSRGDSRRYTRGTAVHDVGIVGIGCTLSLLCDEDTESAPTTGGSTRKNSGRAARPQYAYLSILRLPGDEDLTDSQREEIGLDLVEREEHPASSDYGAPSAVSGDTDTSSTTY
ncbi:hypothetical protein NX059_000596 [Plenodomus lindquistii]|nr:hypothetical protein NX059_000596 [Plenodomus lindquistii]